MRTGFGLVLAVVIAAPALAAGGTPTRTDILLRHPPRHAFPRPVAGDPHRDWGDNYWDDGSYWQDRGGDRPAGAPSGWHDGHHDREMPRR